MVEIMFSKYEWRDGIYDLHSFNLAILAKKVWGLTDEPVSLCDMALRVKYYPFGDILKAAPKKGSPLTWQSLVASIQTFKRGHIWRVGKREMFNIWGDQWVPFAPQGK